MPVNLIECRGTVEFSTLCRHYDIDLKHKGQPLLIHSHSNVFSYYASFIRNSVVLFLFLVILSVRNIKN